MTEIILLAKPVKPFCAGEQKFFARKSSLISTKRSFAQKSSKNKRNSQLKENSYSHDIGIKSLTSLPSPLLVKFLRPSSLKSLILTHIFCGYELVFIK